VIQKKLCMVGVFGTGKTSLVRRFVHSKFSDQYLSTVGVKIDRKPVRVNDRDINLLLWDLEGRDGAQDIQTSYLRGASGILYVVDGTRRETLSQVYEIRDLVDRTVGELPAAVALNKSDLTDAWVITADDRLELSRRAWHVLDTSAVTGTNVEEAFVWLATSMGKDA
jgi:small GTP-binding protein